MWELIMAIPPGDMQRELQKCPFPTLTLEWVLLHTLQAAAWGSRFSLAGTSAQAILSRPKRPSEHSSHLLPLVCFNNKNKLPNISLKETCHMSNTPTFTATTQGISPPYYLDLIANEACIHKSHGAIVNKAAIFKWVQEHHIMAIHLGSMQREKTKMFTSQFLCGKDLTIYFPSCCLRAWLLSSLHLSNDQNLSFGT